MQLKKFKDAERDFTASLQFEDCKVQDEIVSGCYSTKSAALTYLAKLAEMVGDKDKASAMRKMVTELMKTNAKDIDKAAKLKDEGNDCFKVGWERVS
jgi:fructoselysine-6-P-deglycase FrlB-like protein